MFSWKASTIVVGQIPRHDGVLLLEIHDVLHPEIEVDARGKDPRDLAVEHDKIVFKFGRGSVVKLAVGPGIRCGPTHCTVKSAFHWAAFALGLEW